MKIIGLEEHIVSRSIESANNETINSTFPYYKAFQNPAAAAAYGLSFKDLFELGERRIKDLDEAGIDMEIISYTNVTQWLTGDDALRLSKEANDYIASNVKAFPDRFRGFATLPWYYPKVAADELKRTIEELGFVGTLLSGRPQTENIYIDDKIYYPVWEVLTKYDLPIYIHPHFTSADACKAYYSNLSPEINAIFSTMGYGWHFEAGIQVIRMILAGVFEKFPTLKVISGHWGEMVPFYLPRLDMMFPPELTGLPESFSFYYKRNVWVTPGGIYDYDDMEYCIKKMGIDHLLFATDFPYVPLKGARPFVENAPLSEEDKEKFAHLNVEKLIHLS